MSTISLSTAMSGMSAANERMRAAAENVANVDTTGYRRERADSETAQDGGVTTTITKLPEPGTDLDADMVDQQAATYAFIANLKMLETQVRAQGMILDIQV